MPEEIRNLPKKMDSNLNFFKMKKSSFVLLVALMLCMNAYAKIIVKGDVESVVVDDTWGTTTIRCTPSDNTCMEISTMVGTTGNDVLTIGNSGTVVRTGTFVSHTQSFPGTHVVRFQ